MDVIIGSFFSLKPVEKREIILYNRGKEMAVKEIAMTRVLVVGSINVDYVIHTDRVPTLGETVTGRDFAMNFGGEARKAAR